MQTIHVERVRSQTDRMFVFIEEVFRFLVIAQRDQLDIIHKVVRKKSFLSNLAFGGAICLLTFSHSTLSSGYKNKNFLIIAHY